MNDKIRLFGWNYWTTPEGRVNVEHCCLHSIRGIHYNGFNVVEGAPVTPEIIDIDVVINVMMGWVIPREREAWTMWQSSDVGDFGTMPSGEVWKGSD